MKINSSTIRSHFPIFNREINGLPLAYLDTAATSQKPGSVIDTISDYYAKHVANIHRGVHALSEESTELYEGTRSKVAKFVHAQPKEVIFTRNATEAINLVAYTWGEQNISTGDEIVISALEHHANLIPWQELCKRTGAALKVIPLKKLECDCASGSDRDPNSDSDSGSDPFPSTSPSVIPESKYSNESGIHPKSLPRQATCNHNLYTLDIEAGKEILTDKTKLLALSLYSNVLGDISEAALEIHTYARAFTPSSSTREYSAAIGNPDKIGNKITTLLDASQYIVHKEVDFYKLDCDFLAFSSHKMLGPSGVGVLVGKKAVLESMPPFLFGGDMIKTVSFEHTMYADIPHKFEAGTPNIEGVVGLGAAIDFYDSCDRAELSAYEKKLSEYTYEKLSTMPFIKLFVSSGGPLDKGGTGGFSSSSILSFTMDDVHPHDIASILNNFGIAIRSGHHCAEPLLGELGVNALARISLFWYNTFDEIDRAIAALKKAYEIFHT